MIAVKGNPLEDIDALRSVIFVMKDGLVFKRDGVMTPEQFPAWWPGEMAGGSGEEAG